jgi:hypothetical protein
MIESFYMHLSEHLRINNGLLHHQGCYPVGVNAMQFIVVPIIIMIGISSKGML